jgi:hypothetical protein
MTSHVPTIDRVLSIDRVPTIDRVPISRSSRVVALEVQDVGFPTAATLDASDAMYPSPDYAVDYVVPRTTGEVCSQLSGSQRSDGPRGSDPFRRVLH